jgi:hypothetical protein
MAEEPDRVAMLSDLKGFEASLKQEIKQIVVAEAERTRTHFDVVAEGLRGDLKVVIDKTNATSAKVDGLITRNAIEHSAFVDAIADHEVRQRVLERIVEPPATDNS